MEKQEPDNQESNIEDLTLDETDSGNVKAGAASDASFSDPEYKYVTVRG